MPRITSLMPGHSPPQVTTPHLVFEGSKKIFFLGPAHSKEGIFFRSLRQALTAVREESMSTRSLSSTNRVVARRGESMVGSPRDCMVVSISSHMISPFIEAPSIKQAYRFSVYLSLFTSSCYSDRLPPCRHVCEYPSKPRRTPRPLCIRLQLFHYK